jgi:hypothetical protein
VTGVDHEDSVKVPAETRLRQLTRDQYPGRVIRAEGIPDPEYRDPWRSI